MRSIFFVFFVVLILNLGIVSPAQASPAAPSFFEGISEWFGDIFTFGDIAKAERSIKKAEAIFQDLSTNAPKDDSLDPFFKKGLTRYQKHIESVGFYFENAKGKKEDVSSLGKTIDDITHRHAQIFENAKKQWGDKAENIGLLRALEVVKETNARAREAMGQALENEERTEEESIPTAKIEASATPPPSKRQQEQQKTVLPTFAPLQGIWTVERFYIVQVVSKGEVYLDTGTNTKEIPIRSGEKNPYFEFKGDLLCLTGRTDEQGVPGPCPSYEPFTVDGDTITFRQNPEDTVLRLWKWTIKDGKLEIIQEFPGSLPEYGVQRHIYTSVKLDQAQVRQQIDEPQPDYYVSIGSTPEQTGAYIGKSVTFSTLVGNQGAASKQSSVVRLRIDAGNDGNWDIVLQSEPVGSIATNKYSPRITWTWKPTTAAWNNSWEICADTPSSIVESNEVNNCASGSFIVH